MLFGGMLQTWLGAFLKTASAMEADNVFGKRPDRARTSTAGRECVLEMDFNLDQQEFRRLLASDLAMAGDGPLEGASGTMRISATLSDRRLSALPAPEMRIAASFEPGILAPILNSPKHVSARRPEDAAMALFAPFAPFLHGRVAEMVVAEMANGLFPGEPFDVANAIWAISDQCQVGWEKARSLFAGSRVAWLSPGKGTREVLSASRLADGILGGGENIEVIDMEELAKRLEKAGRPGHAPGNL